MGDLFSLAVHSMNSDLRIINIISENVSNVEAVSYKRRMPIAAAVEFDKILNNIQLPTNSELSINTDKSNGSARKTGNPLDIMIEGDWWMEVTKNGHVAYTRVGELTLDDAGYLVTQNGWQVSGDGGSLRLSTVDPSIRADGEIWDGESSIGRIKLVKIEGEVTSIGGGAVTPLNPSEVHEETQGSQLNVRQGFVENSNVRTMNEMLGLMETVRHFELMQRYVTAYDGLLETTITKLGQV